MIGAPPVQDKDSSNGMRHGGGKPCVSSAGLHRSSSKQWGLCGKDGGGGGNTRCMVNRRPQWLRLWGVLKTNEAAMHLRNRAAQTARSTPRGYESGLAHSRKHGGFSQQCIRARARACVCVLLYSRPLHSIDMFLVLQTARGVVSKTEVLSIAILDKSVYFCFQVVHRCVRAAKGKHWLPPPSRYTPYAHNNFVVQQHELGRPHHHCIKLVGVRLACHDE